MAYFRTQPQQLSNAATEFMSVIFRMNAVRNDLRSVASRLGGSSAMRSAKTRVNGAASDMLRLINKANDIRLALLSISGEYRDNESRLVSNVPIILRALPIKPFPGFIPIPPIFPRPIPLPCPLPFYPTIIPRDLFDVLFDFVLDVFPEPRAPLSGPDALDWLFGKTKGVFKFVDKLTGSDTIGAFGDGTSFIANWLKLAQSDPGSKDFWSSLFNTSSDGAGLVEAVYKYTGSAVGEAVSGIVGGVLGIVGETAELMGMDVPEMLKNAGDLTGESVRFIDKGFAPSGLKGKEALGRNVKLSTITSAISMGLYFVGDTYERASDGSYTVDDFANTALGTGITGATTLIEGVTFGLVDIDTEGAINTFKENTDYMTKAIQNTGAPTWAQVVMTVPGAVTVTAWSAVEVAGDFIGDTFNGFVSLFK